MPKRQKKKKTIKQQDKTESTYIPFFPLKDKWLPSSQNARVNESGKAKSGSTKKIDTKKHKAFLKAQKNQSRSVHSRIKDLFGKKKKQKKQKKRLQQIKKSRSTKKEQSVKMGENHLNGAKFRWMNSLLYNSTGDEAMEQINGDVEQFREYHTTYNSIVKDQWPENPLDLIIESLTKNFNVIHHKTKQELFRVADFGCGDAKIAHHFANTPTGRRWKIEVDSFDLVALNDYVTACDISDVSEYLEDESIDCAVFCLSLMGTNFHEYIHEAYRVLKQDGLLMVAEVKSRIISNTKFQKFLNRCGFALEKKDTKNECFSFFLCRLDPRRMFNIPRDYDPRQVLKPCSYKKR